MIYVVSGYMRTGTSMMMNALSAGGLNPLVNREREGVLMKAMEGAAHHPNPSGLFELSHQEAQIAILNPARFDGYLMKVLAGAMTRLAAWQWKVVFMQRPYSEVRQSCEAVFDTKVMRGDEAILDEKSWGGMMRYVQGQMSVRNDIDWMEIPYHGVLAAPVKTFEILRDWGLPIDADKAAATIDPEQCRFRAA
jgi:hypothetical protein